MKVVAAFHAFDCQKFLWMKLMSLRWVDKVIIVFDGGQNETEQSIIALFDNVEVHVRKPNAEVPSKNDFGETMCEEGALRQFAWDKAALHKPHWVILGDTDEILTDPMGTCRTLQHTLNQEGSGKPEIEVFYLRIANIVLKEAVDYYFPHSSELVPEDFYYVTGPKAAYSFNKEGPVNLRGSICRWRPNMTYKYDQRMLAHCRAEPNPVHPRRAVLGKSHKLLRDPVVLHFKWIDWDAWLKNPQSSHNKSKGHWNGAEFSLIPPLWIKDLPWIDDQRMKLSCPSCDARAWGNWSLGEVVGYISHCLACKEGTLEYPDDLA